MSIIDTVNSISSDVLNFYKTLGNLPLYDENGNNIGNFSDNAGFKSLAQNT